MRRLTIRWTEEKLGQFQEAYDEAVKAEVKEFKFEGRTFLVSYAKYLIEYVKAELAKPFDYFSGK